MTKQIFKMRIDTAKRKRAKARKTLINILAVVCIIGITPFAVDAAYISRGGVFKIGGEWLLLPLYFAIRAVIKEAKGVEVWQK